MTQSEQTWKESYGSVSRRVDKLNLSVILIGGSNNHGLGPDPPHVGRLEVDETNDETILHLVLRNKLD